MGELQAWLGADAADKKTATNARSSLLVWVVPTHMDTEELDRALRATLDDGRLSRAERQALSALIAESPLDEGKLAQLRARAFSLAREKAAGPSAQELLGWLEELIKLLAHLRPESAASTSRACFSPGDGCLMTILGELGKARKTADICVFTITDDRITSAILAAHARKVRIRIITDNDKQYDQGSDIERLRGAGIALRVDETEHHMHHKFALLDGTRLLNGSYNWTRSAATFNEENLIVTSDAALVATFTRQFEAMWQQLG
jgi:phosphatidylserine/phosphatidylglycerophosphate/cardiolipin synthase-like enzyme